MALVQGTNSYGTLAGANTYFEDSIYNSTWNAYDDTSKEQGLVQATRILERQAWDGEKSDEAQTLDFPRTGLTDNEGNSVTADESLVYAEEGQYEYALALLEDNSLTTSTNVTGTNIKKLEAGSAKITYFRPIKGSKYPLAVLTILSPFFLGNGAGTSNMAVSGNSDSSSFSDCKSYDLITGFK